jgi:uncharacterized protein (TIGR02594 family)
MIPQPLSKAFEELGQAEVLGDADNPRIQEYLASVGMPSVHDEIPWCSAFVNWTMKQCGILGTNKPNARSWLAWGTAIPSPVLGSVTVFSRGTSSWEGHVAFFLDRGPGLIYVLGGNQGNRVSVTSEPESRLLGYRLPA